MIFFLGLGVVLVWLVIDKLSAKDIEDIKDAFQNADYSWILLTLVLNMSSNVSRTIRWQMLMKPSGYSPSFINTFSALMIGYLANYAVPRLGEVTRCGVLNKYEKVPVSSSLGTVVVERVVDVLSLGVLILVTLAWKHEMLLDLVDKALASSGTKKEQGTSVKMILLIVFGVLFVAGYIFRNRLRRIPLFEKIIGFVKGFISGLKSIKDLEKPWLFIFHSIYIWVMYLLTLYFGFYALSQTSNLPFDAAMISLILGSIGMILVQGGIGAYPYAVMIALGAYGIAEPIGFAFGWLAWVSQTIIYVLVGVVALIFIPVINQKRNVSR